MWQDPLWSAHLWRLRWSTMPLPSPLSLTPVIAKRSAKWTLVTYPFLASELGESRMVCSLRHTLSFFLFPFFFQFLLILSLSLSLSLSFSFSFSFSFSLSLFLSPYFGGCLCACTLNRGWYVDHHFVFLSTITIHVLVIFYSFWVCLSTLN